MPWHRIGHIFCADGNRSWMMSYAGQPWAEHVEGDLHRLYFTSRDAQGRSHIGWLELDVGHPDRILRLADEPLLSPGALGAFDDAGAMVSSVVRHDGGRHVYY